MSIESDNYVKHQEACREVLAQVKREAREEKAKRLTMADVAVIFGRPIYMGQIRYSNSTHYITILHRPDCGIVVYGEPLVGWRFGSECRRGRPKNFSVYNATENYLKRLAVRI